MVNQAEDSSKQKQDADMPKELPPEYYAKLLNLPSCKTNGVCNGCGRCEH